MSIEEEIQALQRIRSVQDELYGDMDKFTIQAILTYLHNSPMTVDEIYDLQLNINDRITQKEVTKKLDILVEQGYATKSGRDSYEPTQKSEQILKQEGFSREILLNN